MLVCVGHLHPCMLRICPHVPFYPLRLLRRALDMTVDRWMGHVCVNVHVSAIAGQRHTPIEKKRVGAEGGVGFLDDVWPGSWELLRSFVPL